MARVIGKRRGGFCCYCRRPLESTQSRSKLAFTRDHINPQHRGGGRTVPCCRFCNGLKSGLAPHEWFWFIDHHPSYWTNFKLHQQVVAAITAEKWRRHEAGEPTLRTTYSERRKVDG